MTSLANNRFLNSTLTIGGVLLVAGLCFSYISFIQGFLEYAMGMFSLAMKNTGHYLQIVPLH